MAPLASPPGHAYVSAFKVKTLVRKKLRLIPQKSHNNARDYIQYKKYIHSIGH